MLLNLSSVMIVFIKEILGFKLMVSYMKRTWRNKLKGLLFGEENSFSNKKTGYWSQIGQDYVSNIIHNNKRNGFFIEVGGYHPYLYSNSFFFESRLGWEGIIFEIDKKACDLIRKNRSCKVFESDVLDFNSEELKSEIPNRVDFLSIDIEPNDSNLKALLKFVNLPSRYSFISFEHNEGRKASLNQKIQDIGFKELTTRNYKRIVKNVLLNSKSTEDWYIDINAIDFLNSKLLETLKDIENVEYLDIIEIIKNLN